ncbi:recombinase family protein [Myxococcota bacterium]|nr:recombinase family protein [Myxococcota bacterium]
MPTIGAAYLRCSDARQDKSIDQQRAEILRRAEADGVVIPPENWFIDEGISGRSTKRRTSYQQLLRRAEAQRDHRRKPTGQRIDRLYVWAFSRVARNMFDALKALAALDEADIDVVSLTEPDAGDRSLRRLIRPILAWLAERYSEELSTNVLRGMRSQAEKGRWVYGLPPFGYEVQDGTLVVTDATRPQFEVVQRVFQMADEDGDGATRIAARLTREAIAPPSRFDLPKTVAPHAWRAKHVACILTNAAYAGHLTHDGEIVARDTHEAAIDDETFARVQAKRRLRDRNRKEGKGNGANPVTLSERGLLTPWLRCGTCGGRICVAAGGTPKKRTFLYYCATRQDNPAACEGISIRVEKLDALVVGVIEEQVLAPDNVEVLIRESVDQLASHPIDHTAAERDRLDTLLTDLDAKIRSTAAQVVNGLIDADDAKAMNAPLLEQRDHARLQRAALPSPQPPPLADTIDPVAFREAIKEAWHGRPLEARRQALDQLLDEVRLSPGGVQITYSLAGHHGHDPYGPPYAPTSLRLPSTSSTAGSPTSTSPLVLRRRKTSLVPSPSSLVEAKPGVTSRLPSVPVGSAMAPA